MELSPEQRLDLLKTEMQLLQGIFNKYDDMIFRSRNWFITLWMATIGLGFTVRVPALFLMAGFLAVLYWVLEGTIRHQYWYKYVVRYRAVREELNKTPANVKGLSLYDLTHHYGTHKPTERQRLWQSFAKLEPFVLYVSLGVAAVVVWHLVATGVIALPPLSRSGN